MTKRRKGKAAVPIALLWTRRDQLRFTEAVEQLAGLVGDLKLLLREPVERAKAAAATRQARQMQEADGPELVRLRRQLDEALGLIERLERGERLGPSEQVDLRAAAQFADACASGTSCPLASPAQPGE